MRPLPHRALLALLLATSTAAALRAEPPSPAAPPAPAAPALRDGAHDFDFLFGTWKFHLRRLEHPLTGEKKWLEFEGKSVCRPIWSGLANYDEVELDGPTGHVQGLTVRLYNPKSHQWSLYWGDSKGGTLPPPPTAGGFDAKNGRGEFYDHEPINGRMVFVRYVWSNITPTSAHFEQAFSEDGGRTWEVNWVTDQERVED